MPVDVSIDADQIAHVMLRNPTRRNALDEEMFRQLAALWPQLETSAVRCVLLTGEGGAFCSGADLSAQLTALPDIDMLIDAALLKTRFFSRPIVAAINGACVAGGFELALSCDIRLCTTTAMFGLPEARWGIFPSGGGVMKLAAAIGRASATDMLLSGRLFDAAEAHAHGLVGQVVPVGELGEAALQTARNIAINSPTVVRSIKRYLHESQTVTPELRKLEQDLTDAVRRAPDARIGAAAFLARETPHYPG